MIEKEDVTLIQEYIPPEYLQELKAMCTQEPTLESAARLSEMCMVRSNISHACGAESTAYHELACARVIQCLLRQLRQQKEK